LNFSTSCSNEVSGLSVGTQRGHLIQGHGRLVGHDGADHDLAADQQRRSALLGGDELGETDGAAGAGNVGHLDAAGEVELLEDLLHGAGVLVPAAAGAGRSEQFQSLDLGGGRQCRHRARRKRHGGDHVAEGAQLFQQHDVRSL
jgi:hypothetical protein